MINIVVNSIEAGLRESLLRVQKMPKKVRTYSRYTKDGIVLLGKLINLGRKQRKMTEKELAERLGIARSTLQRVEQGDARVELGIVFEAATVVGVKLFDCDEKTIKQYGKQIDDRIAVLPKHVYRNNRKVVDEF